MTAALATSAPTRSASDLQRCFCVECVALDSEFPGEGEQLSFVPSTRPARAPKTTKPTHPRGDDNPSTIRSKAMISPMTIADLCLSPYNVRTNSHDANAIDGMIDSLLNVGQLYPLAVHKMPRSKGKGSRGPRQLWGVLAGGRRFRAFEKAIADGRLPSNHPIDVVVRNITSEAELVELSLAENVARMELRPYEVYAATRRASLAGRSFADIAQTNGRTVEVIRQWARLGALEPEIFAALESGTIGQDMAKAFAAVEDQTLQRWAFDQVLEWPHHWRTPERIRALFRFNDSEQQLLLKFVGDREYRDAGGRFELDLFADEADQRGRVADEGLLMQMVEAKFAAARAQIRKQLGRDLRFEAAYPRDRNYDAIAHDLEITAQYAGLTNEDEERLAFITDETLELTHRLSKASDSAQMDELDREVAGYEAEVDAIEARQTLILPEGDIFATLIVEASGDLEIRFWWESRQAMAEAQKAGTAKKRPVSAGPVGKPATTLQAAQPAVTGSAALERGLDYKTSMRADAQICETEGLTQDAIQALRSTRRMALRAVLIEDMEGVGHDFLLWSLARERFGPPASSKAHDRGMGGLQLADDLAPPCAGEMADRTPAAGIWQMAIDQIRRHPSMTQNNLVAALQAFREQPYAWKDTVAAIVAGSVLVRSANADGYRVPIHDELARLCGFEGDKALRRLVEPDEDLVAMLPKAQRITLAAPHVDAATLRGWEKMKAKDLVAPVTRALKRAAAFVHPLLRFGARVDRAGEGAGSVHTANEKVPA